jgi:hypothetical protein
MKEVEVIEEPVVNVDLNTISKMESVTNPEKCVKFTLKLEVDVCTANMDGESLTDIVTELSPLIKDMLILNTVVLPTIELETMEIYSEETNSLIGKFLYLEIF